MAEYLPTGDVTAVNVDSALKAWESAQFNLVKASTNNWYEFWDWGEYSRMKTIADEAHLMYLDLKAAYEYDMAHPEGSYTGSSTSTMGMYVVIGVALLIAAFVVIKIVKS
jgi:hypothetical protein